MGDSITEFWFRQHPDFFTSNNFAGRGISGQCSTQMLCRFQRDVVALNPKVVVTKEGEDISVVPLAMPVIVGPASCGAILVTSAELHTIGAKLMGFAALAVALIFIWVILLLGTWFERQLGKRGISILMRLTALILAALSAQMVMTGVCGFLKG